MCLAKIRTRFGLLSMWPSNCSEASFSIWSRNSKELGITVWDARSLPTLSGQIVQRNAADLAIDDVRSVHHREVIGHSRGVKANDRSASKRHYNVPIPKRNRLLSFGSFVEGGPKDAPTTGGAVPDTSGRRRYGAASRAGVEARRLR
jgi:hypothetical protein